jgi:tRNA A58 N-methylase Trm61
LSLEPGRYELVDYGSGKGKLLFLASRYPFKKIIGVEFDHRLHQQAVKNLATYKGARRCEDIELLHMDALKYDHPNGPSLLVFYSPFHTELLERVLERIRQGVEKDPRETIICFFDDVVWNSQVPKVHKIVSQWRDWQTEEIYRVKRSWDMLYASEAVISRWTPDNGNIVDV